jgi:tetratricopeptide (TPR) repeat protein
MQFSRARVFLAATLFVIVRLNALGAADPEIDRLLKKLPPPEKLVHIDERILRVNDPALHDPLLKQIEAADKAKQAKRALELARQLAARYPSSAAANFYAGYFASEQKRYPEASTFFRRALALQPSFVVVHYCLGFVEWRQQHFNLALEQFRAVTKLEPRAAAGWAVLSICAEMVGAREESVIAARHLVVLEPRKIAAWVRLAMAENSVGNHGAAQQAMNRAIALQRAMKPASTKKASPVKKKQ